MKKLALVILGIILGALAMYFYFHSDKNTNDMAQEPKGMITPAEITALTQAYNDRYQTITDTYFKGIADGDNRSSWYSLEDLESFLAIAKQEATDAGYTMDGVRLYLGAHPKVDNIPGFTTLLFVPTGYEGNSQANKGGGSVDIPGNNGFDRGGNGIPPGANYPQ